MYKAITVLLFFYIIPHQLQSQIVPKEGSTLHYRLIGFSFPARAQPGKYNIEIAAGNYYSEDSFIKHIIKSVDARNNKIIAEVPSFGAPYTWRSVFTANNSTIINSALHHFSTKIIPGVNPDRIRFRILKPAKKYQNALVFLDANKAMYDMSGNPVWYLPDIEGLINENSEVRDLKLSPQGTITFILDDKRAYEIDYNGNILWKGPNNENDDNDIHYHHEFTRLANGNYMILGTESVLLKLKYYYPKDSIAIVSDTTAKRDSNTYYPTFPFGMITEYDKKGQVVWSWKTSENLDRNGLYYYSPKRSRNRFDVHLNAFFFDEKNKHIYLGFRNISWIIKIQYPGRKIMNVYGEIMKKGIPQKGNDLFYGQHSIRRSSDGYLYVFNNNAYSLNNLPDITLFKEPSPGNGRLEKIWEYKCTADGENELNGTVYGFTTGGNAVEMPDHSLFVSMNDPYGKIFIVGRNKEILWSGIAEKWMPSEKKWKTMTQYRASIISSPKEIERLIWNGMKK